MNAQLACQAIALLLGIAWNILRMVLELPYWLLKNALLALRGGAPGAERRRSRAKGRCWFYEGMVTHARRAPATNKFAYPVRMAVVDLDDPPAWWAAQAHDHLTANAARRFAGTDGAVLVLTNPKAAGYIQNPISVYYCHDRATGALARGIAEVTNTPWAERVTFVFNPGNETVPKALHVSPLMDMANRWRLVATPPAEKLKLSVLITHPVHGAYFDAHLVAQRAKAYTHLRNEEAGFANLWRYGFQPQRVAAWIYWQAVVLLRKGVPFYGPPCKGYQQTVAKGATHPRCGFGEFFVWADAKGWPWRTA